MEVEGVRGGGVIIERRGRERRGEGEREGGEDKGMEREREGGGQRINRKTDSKKAHAQIVYSTIPKRK